jgi:hypothetical protein
MQGLLVERLGQAGVVPDSGPTGSVVCTVDWSRVVLPGRPRTPSTPFQGTGAGLSEVEMARLRRTRHDPSHGGREQGWGGA